MTATTDWMDEVLKAELEEYGPKADPLTKEEFDRLTTWKYYNDPNEDSLPFI